MLPTSLIVTVPFLMLFLVQCTSSPIYTMQPAHITANIGASSGRNIRHLPCVSRRSGLSGTCMFAIDCLKANGTHLGTCIDRFYFGSCCHIEMNTDVSDNVIIDTALIPVRQPPNRLSTISPSERLNITTTVLASSSSHKPIFSTESLSSKPISTTQSTGTTQKFNSTNVQKVSTPQNEVKVATTTESYKLSTFQSVETATSSDTTTIKNKLTTKPVKPPPKPLKPISTTTRKPPRPSSKPVATSNKPVTTGSKPVSTGSKPGRPSSSKPTPRPSSKPSSRPSSIATSRPTSKPTSRPTNKTTSKPVSKPTSKPISKPVTSKPSVKPIKPVVTTSIRPSSKPVKTTVTQRITTAKPSTQKIISTSSWNSETRTTPFNTKLPSVSKPSTVYTKISSTYTPISSSVTKVPSTTELPSKPTVFEESTISSIISNDIIATSKVPSVETVNGNTVTNEIESVQDKKPAVTTTTERPTSQLPAFITWAMVSNEETTKESLNVTGDSEDEWTPITPPDGWVLLPNVATTIQSSETPSSTILPFSTFIPTAFPNSQTSFSSSTPSTYFSAITTPPPTPSSSPPPTSSSTSSSTTVSSISSTSSPDSSPGGVDNTERVPDTTILGETVTFEDGLGQETTEGVTMELVSLVNTTGEGFTTERGATDKVDVTTPAMLQATPAGINMTDYTEGRMLATLPIWNSTVQVQGRRNEFSMTFVVLGSVFIVHCFQRLLN